MNVVAKFERVSVNQFTKDVSEKFNIDINDKECMSAIMSAFDNVKLPVRATTDSAGYDFVAPITFELKPGESIILPTGIRCKIETGWVLVAVPRSSLGFKYQMTLANTVGVIDADYYNAKNEGHIMAKIVNRGDSVMRIEAGERFMQGIFLPYGITSDDNVTKLRDGGIGSSGK